MATSLEWANAFLAQARADLRGAQAVAAAGEPSVFAMLLQMAFEKFAKAALLRSGQTPVTLGTHKAASRMVLAMRRQRGLIAPLGGPWAWSDVFNLIDELEQAHPSVAVGGPMLEYPWEDANGAIQWPARDLAIAKRLARPGSNLGGRALNFAKQLDDRFDQIFT